MRLAEIDAEFLAMGMTPKMVDDYVSGAHTDHVWPTCCLPPGTMPHTEYKQRLENLVEVIEQADKAAEVAEVALEKTKLASAAAEAAIKQCKMTNSQKIIAEQLARQTESLKRQIMHPKVLKNELYLHLTLFRPIDTKAHFKKLDALVDEKMRILTEMHRAAIREME
jgi:hypothetical protein